MQARRLWEQDVGGRLPGRTTEKCPWSSVATCRSSSRSVSATTEASTHAQLQVGVAPDQHGDAFEVRLEIVEPTPCAARGADFARRWHCRAALWVDNSRTSRRCTDADVRGFSGFSHASVIFRRCLLPTVNLTPRVRETDMELLIVEFNLEDLGAADYRRSCEEEASAFAGVPGLVSKTWLADEAANTYGGVYLFVDRDAMDAYIRSDLFRAMSTDPHLVNVTARTFGILEAPSRITRGLPTVAV